MDALRAAAGVPRGWWAAAALHVFPRAYGTIASATADAADCQRFPVRLWYNHGPWTQRFG